MVSDDEIKEAVFQMGSLKSPGPDGFSGIFYQQYWDVVGLDVCKAVRHFFEGGFLLKELNFTNLVLIPKIQIPESLSQYRPISLCNFSLKIITKVMANRLKKILNSFISANQSAFVPGRMIQDSIIVAHEAFHFLGRKKAGRDGFMAIKLDFNKAFDRVEWDFLEALLVKMGFHNKWVNWVMECVSTVKFAVIANGETRANIVPQRGLRQGDPLSPYLFLLVKDVLSNLIQQELNLGQLGGIHINRHCPTLSHIFFADDALLFAKAELGECRKIKRILESYGTASGQVINFAKSGIFFSSNMGAMDKQLICDFMNIDLLRGDAKYLGLPSFWGRSKAEAYTFLVEKSLKKMQGWKLKMLNQAGKETMLKSVVQAIPSYAMACFLLPKKLCNKLDTLSRNFWWKGNPEDRGVCWVAWDKMSCSKAEGGMGFRNYRAFNEALLAKQSWRLLMNPQSYWSRILKGIYFPNSSFLQASRGGHPSWAWLSILHGRDLLSKGLRWQVQDGASINFWDDRWIPSLQNFQIQTAKPPNSTIQWVADVINARTGKWDAQKLASEVSFSDLDAILSISLPIIKRGDNLVWHHNANGIYSVKSGYHISNQSRLVADQFKPQSSFQPNPKLWKAIWKLNIPNKVKNFWWRVCRNSLASKENLFRRKCATSNVCPICNSHVESIEHLLFFCSWTRAVWFGSNILFNGSCGAPKSAIQWTANVFDSMSNGDASDFIATVAFIAWYIWKSRNDFVFRNTPVDPLIVMAKANFARMEFSNAFVLPSVQMDNQPSSDVQSTWAAPDSLKYKVNCDAAFSKDGGDGSIAVVMRNWDGKLVDGWAKSVKISSPLQGELLAIREACLMISALGMKEVSVESDNKQAILLSASELVPPWEASAVVLDIRELARMGGILFKWVRREANKAAQSIAALAKNGKLPLNWVSSPPFQLLSILNSDFAL